MKILHRSKTESAYKDYLVVFKNKYAKNHKAMYDHIFDTWINSSDHTCRWQAFRNKPGFANTNSPLESYNSRLKTDYFKRIVRSIGGVLDVFKDEIIPFESENFKKCKPYPRYIKKTEDLAIKLTRKNLKKLYKDTYSYTGVNNRFVIKMNLPRYYKGYFCDCESFMKDGVCMHLVAFSWLVSPQPFYKNYCNDPKVFATSTKRGRHKNCKKALEIN